MRRKVIIILIVIIVLNMSIVTSENSVSAIEPDVTWLGKEYSSTKLFTEFSEGLAIVGLKGRWGYIDYNGREVIPLSSSYSVSPFSEGMALIEQDLYSVGYLDNLGRKKIEPKYLIAEDFKEGRALVYTSSNYSISGNELLIMDQKCGYIDINGNEVTPLIYSEAKSFSEGLAVVELNEKYGYIDKDGNTIIPFIYDDASSFGEGLALVRLNNRWSYIDKSGKEKISLIYDYSSRTGEMQFNEGLTLVGLNGKYGYIDKFGKEVVPLIYDRTESFSEGLAAVKLNGKWGYIDKSGNKIIPLIYDATSSFSEGLAAVKLNGKWGYIDENGKEVIPIKYDRAHPFKEGHSLIRLGEKTGIMKTPNNINKGEEDKILTLNVKTNSLKLQEGKTSKISLNIDPLDVKLSYSTSDPWVASVSSNGTIIGHRPGTAVISVKATKTNYKEEIKNINVIVTGLKEFNLILEPNLLILNEGDTRKITSNLATDVRLTSNISNPFIVDLEMQGTGGRLLAKNIGESNISFAAEKDGYRTDYVDGKVIVLDKNYNSNDIVKQSISHWYNIIPTDKVTRPIREKIVQDAETIITSLTRTDIEGNNGVLVLNRHMIEDMLGDAKGIKEEIDKYIRDIGIIPARKTAIKLIADTNLAPINGIISIQLNKNDLIKHKELDYIYIYLKEYGVTFGIDLETINQQFSNVETIIINIEKQKDDYIVNLKDGEAKEIKTLNRNIIMVLPTDLMNPYESSIFRQDNIGITQIGGSYDLNNQGISIQTKTGGKYYVSENIIDFSDISIKDEEMKTAIRFLSSKGIITGKSDKTFNPDGTLTRAEFTTMLVKSFYALDANLIADFKDVKLSDWYHDYVASSQKENIVQGFDDGTFRANASITKEQMIALVSRSLVSKKQYLYPNNSEDYLTYLNDSNKISEWAKKEVALAIRERTMEISNDFMFDPKGTVTRGEAARILYRMFLKLY